jgi:glycosyltransferase involved in cell wall biosynthesis
MATEISRATLSVCPMRFGSGMQTKILEAMATQTPVVATSKALEGIPSDLHEFIGRADAPEAFADSVVRTLKEPDRVQKAAGEALQVIRRNHTWRHHVAELEKYYFDAVGTSVSDRQGR